MDALISPADLQVARKELACFREARRLAGVAALEEQVAKYNEVMKGLTLEETLGKETAFHLEATEHYATKN